MNLSLKLYNQNLQMAFDDGRRAGIQEGRDQIKSELQKQALEAKIKLVNAVGQTLLTQNSLLDGLAATLNSSRIW